MSSGAHTILRFPTGGHGWEHRRSSARRQRIAGRNPATWIIPLGMVPSSMCCRRPLWSNVEHPREHELAGRGHSMRMSRCTPAVLTGPPFTTFPRSDLTDLYESLPERDNFVDSGCPRRGGKWDASGVPPLASHTAPRNPRIPDHSGRIRIHSLCLKSPSAPNGRGSGPGDPVRRPGTLAGVP
jgi:hypothetical protein